MKKYTILIIATLFASCSNAQKLNEKNVPIAVKDAFQKEYPNITNAKWEYENGNYEVNFNLENKEASLLIDEQGDILETEIEIKTSELPKTVIDYTNANYKGKRIKEAARIINSKGEITYEAEIKGMDLIFDSNGNFIKTSKE
ncbi:MAG: PepSY-like domain-containing protein [Bacteroidales bacterium]|nr:PepSY-like domain-containing protein [Bacteroidales bacterium]